MKKFIKKCINNSVIDEFIRNFLSTVTRHDYSDYIGKIWNTFENVYTSWKISIDMLQVIIPYTMLISHDIEREHV